LAYLVNDNYSNHIGDVMRYVIGHLCIDSEGKYSVDIPQPEQGGGLGGLGTVRVGDGELAATLEYMQASIKTNEETIKARIKRIEEKKNESNT
jgi:hypothetical protein